MNLTQNPSARRITILAAGFVLAQVALTMPVRAAVLWGLDATVENSNTPSNSNVGQTLAANVSGTDGNGYGASGVGLSAFDTEASGAGNIYIRHASNSGTTINYATGYTEFTVAAQSGYLLYLDNLTWDSAAGSNIGTRGFELYGIAEGTPTISDLLLDVNAETGRRNTPVTRTAVLGGPEFQGIESVTFRYYPLTDGGARTIEFANLVLNGSVSEIPISNPVPEPSAMLLVGLGTAALFSRRRRQRLN